MDKGHSQERYLSLGNVWGSQRRAMAGDSDIAEGEYYALQWLFVL